MKKILGCNIPFSQYSDVEAAVKSELKDGMMLSRVSEVSGPEPSTIQNWVKRGYIPRADGKKYSASQAAAVILLNNLGSALSLEKAAEIISKAEKQCGVDCLEMLILLCEAIINATRFNSTDKAALAGVINSVLDEKGTRDKNLSAFLLTAALCAMAAQYKAQAAESI